MTRNFDDTSFPFLHLAERFGLPYWAVLSFREHGNPRADEAERLIHDRLGSMDYTVFKRLAFAAHIRIASF